MNLYLNFYHTNSWITLSWDSTYIPVALDGFHSLLSPHLTVDLTLKCSNRSMFYPLSQLHEKSFSLRWNSSKQLSDSSTHCCFWLTMRNCVTILNRAFSCSNVYAKWWKHCLLISLTYQLSHVTLIYDRPKQFCGLFFTFCGRTAGFVWQIPKGQMVPSNLRQQVHAQSTSCWGRRLAQTFNYFWALGRNSNISINKCWKAIA